MPQVRAQGPSIDSYANASGEDGICGEGGNLAPCLTYRKQP